MPLITLNMMEDILLLLIIIVPSIIAVITAYKIGGSDSAIKTAIEQAEKILKIINEMKKDEDIRRKEDIRQKNKNDKNTGKRMSDEVRKFLTSNMSSEDKEKTNKIIDENEAKGIYEYEIRLSQKWYKIKDGQIAGSAIYVDK